MGPPRFAYRFAAEGNQLQTLFSVVPGDVGSGFVDFSNIIFNVVGWTLIGNDTVQVPAGLGGTYYCEYSVPVQIDLSSVSGQTQTINVFVELLLGGSRVIRFAYEEVSGVGVGIRAIRRTFGGSGLLALGAGDQIQVQVFGVSSLQTNDRAQTFSTRFGNNEISPSITLLLV